MSDAKCILRFWGRGLIAVALLTVVTLALPAAAQVATGVIEVSTVDQDSLPMPGVTVRVVNPETGMQRVAVSDPRGESVFAALPPGGYNVSVNLEGFAPAEQAIIIRIGQTGRLIFTLMVQMSETITVTGEAPLVDVLKTDSSTNITPEQIQDLPVPSREFERLAFIAPGTNRERGTYRFIQGSAVVGAGGNASQTTFMVDGVELTDQALGLSRARFSQDAIQEFRVITARFDPEIGGSQGGALSVATKSGTNTVHGSVFGFYRDADLRQTGALEVDNNDYSRYQYGLTIGGPISRDKIHYFLSAEQINEDTIAPFRPGGAFTDLATDYPFGFDQTLALGSLDFQLGSSASGFAKIVYERFRMENFRVGGVSDVSHGQQLNRDNWNITLGHTAVFGEGGSLNELRFQGGQRNYEEPTNSDALEEWFTSGATLQIGTNTVGDLVGYGDYFEVRDTYHWHTSGAKSTQDFKLGGSVMHIKERSDIPVYQGGTMLYATDTRDIPFVYIYGVGSADVTTKTDLISVFFNDDWRPVPNFTLSMGLRYDLDTKGNNPDFDASPLVGPRDIDRNNFQPRLGFSWDLGGNAKSVLRGGAGLFVGRYLLVPAFTELQQNGTTGRVVNQRLNGAILGLPPAYWLDPTNPQNTGILLSPSATLLEDSMLAPQTLQTSLGFTQRLGNSGLYLDLEGVYAKGYDEIAVRDTNWNGNDDPTRPNSSWTQINKYGNYGRSEYKAVTLGVNGTFGSKGHLLTSSLTWTDKKNISDDFSPVFPYGYPSDPANMEAEFGRSRGAEDLRFVLSGVFRLPANFTIGTTYIYGSGQPWNQIVAYDYNGDGKTSDRLPGVERNSMDGPSFSQFNLRLMWTLKTGAGDIDFIAEGFNVFNTTNYDVASVNNFIYLSGPTLANPTIPIVENPNFGEYRATLDPLEIQLGIRFRF